MMTARKMPAKMTMKTPPKVSREIAPVSSLSSSQFYSKERLNNTKNGNFERKMYYNVLKFALTSALLGF